MGVLRRDAKEALRLDRVELLEPVKSCKHPPQGHYRLHTCARYAEQPCDVNTRSFFSTRSMRCTEAQCKTWADGLIKLRHHHIVHDHSGSPADHRTAVLHFPHAVVFQLHTCARALVHLSLVCLRIQPGNADGAVSGGLARCPQTIPVACSLPIGSLRGVPIGLFGVSIVQCARREVGPAGHAAAAAAPARRRQRARRRRQRRPLPLASSARSCPNFSILLPARTLCTIGVCCSGAGWHAPQAACAVQPAPSVLPLAPPLSLPPAACRWDSRRYSKPDEFAPGEPFFLRLTSSSCPRQSSPENCTWDTPCLAPLQARIHTKQRVPSQASQVTQALVVCCPPRLLTQ